MPDIASDQVRGTFAHNAEVESGNTHEASYVEQIRDSQQRISQTIQWTSPAKTTKLVEATYTRNANGDVTSIEQKVYDVDFGLRYTTTIAYTRDSSGRLVDETRTQVFT